MNKFFGISIILCFVIAAGADACEPCGNRLNLEETFARADLIIVGQKSAYGDPIPGNKRDQTDWIDVRVLEVLKGQEEKKTIRVNSYDAMCPYGITIDDQVYIIFLVREENAEDKHEYDAVDNGCAVKTFSLQGGTAQIEYEQIGIDNFMEKLDSLLKKEQ